MTQRADLFQPPQPASQPHPPLHASLPQPYQRASLLQPPQLASMPDYGMPGSGPVKAFNHQELGATQHVALLQPPHANASSQSTCSLQPSVTQQVFSGASGLGAGAIPTSSADNTHTIQVGAGRCDNYFGPNNDNSRNSFVRQNSNSRDYFVNTNNSNSRDYFVPQNTNYTRDYFVRPGIPILPTYLLNEIEDIVTRHTPTISNGPNVIAK